MFIRLSTYLYGCRFCSDALDSATQPSATDLPSWSLQHWRRGFKLHRYFTRCMMSYVYIYILYIYLPVFFATFSHPSFVFLHIWCPCEISPSSFCLWPLANLTSCSSWWTIWAGPTSASTGILPSPSPLWRPIWIAWPVTRLLLVNLMGEALRYMNICVIVCSGVSIFTDFFWVVNMYGWFLEAQVPNYLKVIQDWIIYVYLY